MAVVRASRDLAHAVGFVVACALGAGCSSAAADLAVAPKLEAAKTLDGARCSLASSRPLVIEWPGDERGALEVRLRRGVTPVRYTGCSLTVLSRCSVPRSSYSYSGLSPKVESHTFSTSDDLHAHMPVGASNLEASLKAAGHLDLEMTLVGRLEASATSVRASELEGEDCGDATHVVGAATIGAFRLDTGGEATVGGSAKTPEVAVGGTGSAKRGALTADGDVKACAGATVSDKQAPPRCGALLRLELAPIDGRVVAARVERAEPVCPPGQRWTGSGCASGGPDAHGVTAHAAPQGAGRLIVQGGAVFDTSTGLSWQRAPSPRRIGWEAAKAYCRSLVIDGKSSFRLPKRAELATLIVAGSSGARIDGDAFPATPAAPFWTFNEDRSSPGDVWALDFSTGKPVSSGLGQELDVRCVR